MLQRSSRSARGRLGEHFDPAETCLKIASFSVCPSSSRMLLARPHSSRASSKLPLIASNPASPDALHDRAVAEAERAPPPLA